MDLMKINSSQIVQRTMHQNKVFVKISHPLCDRGELSIFHFESSAFAGSVSIYNIENSLQSEFTELKCTPVKPHSLYSEIPVKVALGSSHCVICAKTKLCCGGRGMALQGIFHVCPTSKRDCFQQIHQIRNGIQTTYLNHRNDEYGMSVFFLLNIEDLLVYYAVYA